MPFPVSKNVLFTGVLSALMVAQAQAAGNVGKSQTYGPVSLEPGQIGSSYNPAAGMLVSKRLPENRRVVGELGFGGGLEYGNVEDLFDVIDEVAASLSETGGGGGGGPVDNGGVDLGGIDLSNPQLEDLVDRVSVEATRIASLLAVVATEGYARATLDSQASLVVANVLGGALSFDVSSSVTGGFLGIVDPLNFDSEAALSNLEQAFDLTYGDPITTYDLTAGVSLTVDPSTEDVEVDFVNDSLLLTRAISMQEFSLGYSREFGAFERGHLYWGVAPKLMHAGLSDVAFRLGDISDSEAIFDDIRDRDFNYSDRFNMDVGVVWTADYYSLGARVKDLLEPEFEFPAIDTTAYQKPETRNMLKDIQQYKMKRQLTLEGNLTSGDKHWTLNGLVDTNEVEDILGFEYQWMRISGGWHSGSWIIPDVRLGYHKNMAGSELSYFSGGVTLLKYVNLDFAMTADTVELDGDELPRGVDVALSFNYAF